MAIHISGARTDLEGLDALKPAWEDWHRHHRAVSELPQCWGEPEASWGTRLDWYRRLIADGACYLTAGDDDGALIGYAVVVSDGGRDDQADGEEGIAEVVTLAVRANRRSAGVGRALLRAAEDLARDRGLDTMRIAVVARNSRAQGFYESCGYAVGEHVLYRSLVVR